jgi:hypothetical protein
MKTISESIEADVPVKFANREWSEFMFRSLYGGRAADLADVRWWIDESDADRGIVKFAPEGDNLSKVTVDLKCGVAPGAGENALRERLRRDLEHYRDFVAKRCEETHCRQVA